MGLKASPFGLKNYERQQQKKRENTFSSNMIEETGIIEKLGIQKRENTFSSNTIEFFKDYRETGYSKAIEEANEIASTMGVDPVFPEKRLIRRKKQHGESSSSQDVSFTPEENFRVNYFLYIVDKALSSLEARFDQLKNYEKLFGFLFPHNLRVIEDKELKLSCDLLSNALKFKKRSDIDGKELYTELKLFDNSQTDEFSNPIEIMKRLKELGYFPNATIAYRILLTIPVTVASAERSFSKLKLLKSYLRSKCPKNDLADWPRWLLRAKS